MLNNDVFLQMNIWGLIGAVLSFFALLISIYCLNKFKAKIIFKKIELSIKNPNQIIEWYGNKTDEQMKNHVLDFNLKINLENIGGRMGHIEKPTLILSIKSHQIKILPFRVYSEPADRNDTASWKDKMIGQQIAWELQGGQILNDEIKYVINNLDDLNEIINNYSDLKYSIEFKDSSGRVNNSVITSIVIEN